MTNLYDFLRNIHDRATIGDKTIGSIRISPEEIQWIEQFLTSPDIELHFKGTKVPDTPTEENRFAQDYAIKGEPLEIFSMITEAMLQNPSFANVICAAREFYFDHGRVCQECADAYLGADPVVKNWNFTPHKPI